LKGRGCAEEVRPFSNIKTEKQSIS
jgi:hypothetical protein